MFTGSLETAIAMAHIVTLLLSLNGSQLDHLGCAKVSRLKLPQQ